MHNPKDIQFIGKHDFDNESARRISNYAKKQGIKTVSVSVFQWCPYFGKLFMKPGKCKVRVRESVDDIEKVLHQADLVVKLLDAGEWDGRKTVTVR